MLAKFSISGIKLDRFLGASPRTVGTFVVITRYARKIHERWAIFAVQTGP